MEDQYCGIDAPDMQEVLLAIGKIIRAERIRMGHTQEGFAAIMGFNRSYLGQVERGLQNLTLETCCKFSKAINIDLDKFISEAFRMAKH